MGEKLICIIKYDVTIASEYNELHDDEISIEEISIE